jgi:hypothetical protein
MLSTSKSLFRNPTGGGPGPGPTDPSFAYVPLLLNTGSTNGQNNQGTTTTNGFLDSSSNNFTITRNGTPTQGSITPYWPNGQWSNYFNGSTDYLSAPANAAFAFGIAAWTVEAWVYVTTLQDSQLFDTRTSVSTSGIGCRIAANGTLGYSGNANNSLTSTAITANSWNHVAWSYDGTTLSGYINGVRGGTATPSFNLSQNNAFISRVAFTPAEYIAGYISNLRVVKGVAVYSGASFTPPASPLQRTQAGNGGTIQAITGTQTSLLTCQSNRFIDNGLANSGQPFPITVNGTPTVQAFQPFSPTASYTTALYGGSGYFNGSTDYLSFTDSFNGMDLGGATASLEMWVYPTTSNSALLTKGGGVASYSTTNGIEYTFAFASSVFTFYSNNGGSFQTLTDSIARPLNTWYHLVVATNATIQSLYVNGTRTATITAGIAKPTTRTGVRFGLDWGSSYYSGYMSNVRFVQGAGAYDASQTTITVPTAPVTAITNTSLLLNMTNAGIYDAAVQNDLTTVADAKTDTTIKQWPLSSVKFDGTGDFLRMVDAPVFDLGSSDFTIEAWVYTASSGTLSVYSRETPSSNGVLFSIASGSLAIQLGSSSSSYGLTLIGGAVSLSTWTYVAVTRSGSGTNNIKLYQGTTPGAAIAAPSNQGTFSGSIYTTSGMVPIVGARNTNGDLPFNGYIQDFRFTRGVGRTISTVPSASFPTR